MPSLEITDKMKCRVGAARSVITPPVGTSLAGYFHDRVSKSVRDDLHARAAVIESDGVRIAFVTCDLVSVVASTTGPAKEIIAAESGIAPDQVLIVATHTHTGPEIRNSSNVPKNDEYVARLPRIIADTVKNATREMTPCSLHVGRTEVTGYSFNRLFRLKDSSEVFGIARAGGIERIIRPAGPIDPEMITLSARDEEGQLRLLLINFALHPDVIGGGTADFISADWPGEMMGIIERTYGPQAACLFLQGAAGDINHVAHDPTYLPTGGPQKAMQIARALAGAAMTANERAEPMSNAKIHSRICRIPIPFYTRTPEILAEAQAIAKRGPTSDFERAIMERVPKWPHDGQIQEVPIHIMRLGETVLAGFAAEIFTKIGLEIKHFSPTRHTIVVELADDRVSTYVPTTDQAERNAYGAKPILSRWLCADAGRRMADEALKQMHEIYAG